jgi:hypothetical protein
VREKNLVPLLNVKDLVVSFGDLQRIKGVKKLQNIEPFCEKFYLKKPVIVPVFEALVLRL